MNILIVDCLAREKGERKSSLDVIGVGPRAIAGVLEAMREEPTIKVFEEILENPWKISQYDALMISAMSSDRVCALRTLRYWQRYGGGPVIIGGPIGEEYERLLARGFDLVVVGEGERPVEVLVEKALDRDGIVFDELRGEPGFAYRLQGRVVFNGRSPWHTRRMLDSYQHSVERITDYPLYWGARVYVEVVRGCSNFYRPRIRLADGRKCIDCDLCRSGSLRQRLGCPLDIPPGCGYCSVPGLYGPPRSKSIDRIYWEVKGLVDKGVTRIVLSAPDFLDYGRDWLVEPEPLTDPRNPPPNIEALKRLLETLWRIPEIAGGEVAVMVENIKANLVSEEIARLLAEYLQGTPVHIGCETGSREHAILLGRPVYPEECIKATRILASYGLRPYLYFIHGLPGQTLETAKETVRVMEEVFRAGAEKVTVYRFRPLPGTAFEGFPPGKPGVKDRASRLIYEKGVELNRRYKEQLVGKTLKAIIVGERKRGEGVAYPFYHGPVIVVENASRYYGFLVEVEITRVLSERLVGGKIKRVLRRVKPF